MMKLPNEQQLRALAEISVMPAGLLLAEWLGDALRAMDTKLRQAPGGDPHTGGQALAVADILDRLAGAPNALLIQARSRALNGKGIDPSV